MAALSDYLEKAVLDHVLANTALSSPVTVYAALFTTATTDAGGGTEVSAAGTAYARVAITFAAAATPGGTIANNADVLFAQATANWGTVTHMAIYDASTAGNSLFHGILTASKIINTLDTFKIPAGSLVVTLA